MSVSSWDFDLSHSSVGFSVRHLVVSKVRGRFNGWRGSLRFDEKHPERSSVEVEIDAASVDTGDQNRDKHLRAPDFFDVERFPHLSFKSTRVIGAGDGTLSLIGDLTIRGVTRPVELEVEYGGSVKDPWGKERIGFTASATINRKDFGLEFDMILDSGGVAIGDKVSLSIDIEATRASALVGVELPAQGSQASDRGL
jgi:polyisoprenoid-binding protein YceI